MTPPVRGWSKAVVAGALVASGTATGALVGFATGVAWVAARLPVLPVAAVLAVVLLASAADAAHRRGRLPAPLAVPRQVPAVWSQLFSPAVVALLYGGRLGVGPLTLLASWGWWAVVVAGASLGPAGSSVTGGAFGLARGLAMMVVAEAVRHDSVRRMARLAAAEAGASGVLAVLAVGVCVVAGVA